MKIRKNTWCGYNRPGLIFWWSQLTFSTLQSLSLFCFNFYHPYVGMCLVLAEGKSTNISDKEMNNKEIILEISTPRVKKNKPQ